MTKKPQNKKKYICPLLPNLKNPIKELKLFISFDIFFCWKCEPILFINANILIHNNFSDQELIN
jgi:hypothetical protein